MPQRTHSIEKNEVILYVAPCVQESHGMMWHRYWSSGPLLQCIQLLRYWLDWRNRLASNKRWHAIFPACWALNALALTALARWSRESLCPLLRTGITRGFLQLFIPKRCSANIWILSVSILSYHKGRNISLHADLIRDATRFELKGSICIVLVKNNQKWNKNHQLDVKKQQFWHHDVSKHDVGITSNN